MFPDLPRIMNWTGKQVALYSRKICVHAIQTYTSTSPQEAKNIVQALLIMEHGFPLGVMPGWKNMSTLQ